MLTHLDKSQKINVLRITVSALLFTFQYIPIFNSAHFSYVPLIILTIAYLLSGYDVLYKAFKNIIAGKILDENFLMCIATVGAYFLGDYKEAVAVMLFYQIGELFQDYAVTKSRRSIASLMDISPEYANIYENATLKSVDPSCVCVGDIIVVKPGERVPLDGIVVKGDSRIDTSSITGESVSVRVCEGEEIFSGSINLNSLLEIEVTKEFEDSTVSKILELVEEASFNKSRSEDFITSFAKIYTPIVVACALLVAFVPVLFGGVFSQWLRRALIFLVVSCPCALVISVPLSFFAAIGCASSKGVLIKGSNRLELLGKVQSVVFDKTGTLTKGNFKITSVLPSNGSDRESLMFAATICEYFSDHPIANAIKNECCHIKADDISDFQNYAGLGVKALYKGSVYRCGNSEYISKYIDGSLLYVNEPSVVYVSRDSEFLGSIVVSDEIKPEAIKTIDYLHNKKISVTMLTGDRTTGAEYVANKLGISDVRSELLPADKTNELKSIISSKPKGKSVVYVGDGINDAPVIALADVGVAMGSLGSDAAIEAADVVIMDDNVSKIPLAIALCKKTNTIVRQNVVFAIGIKVLVMIAATLGYSNMWAAIFADVGVAVLAIINSLRCFRI